MLISEIGYLRSVNNAVITEASNKNQNQRTASLEGFGNYEKKSSYKINQLNICSYIRNSLESLFTTNKTVDNSKKISLLA